MADEALAGDFGPVACLEAPEAVPVPASLLAPTAPVVARLMALRNHATDANARQDIAGLPRQLQRIDGWIEEGLIGGEQPNAADLQLGATIRLLSSIADVRPLLAEHEAMSLRRHFPPLAGEVPAGALPAEWFAG